MYVFETLEKVVAVDIVSRGRPDDLPPRASAIVASADIPYHILPQQQAPVASKCNIFFTH